MFAQNLHQKLIILFLAMWITLMPAQALIAATTSSDSSSSSISDDHMPHNNNFDMIMPDDHEPAESMHYQNFDTFYNAETKGNSMSEMEMAETYGGYAQVRAPQPLSERERQVRQHVDDFDVQREKQYQQYLRKGNSKPRREAHDWDQFDYEAYVN